MGSADSKLNFRKAVIQLTTKTQVRAAMSRGGCGEGRGGEGAAMSGAAPRGPGWTERALPVLTAPVLRAGLSPRVSLRVSLRVAAISPQGLPVCPEDSGQQVGPTAAVGLRRCSPVADDAGSRWRSGRAAPIPRLASPRGAEAMGEAVGAGWVGSTLTAPMASPSREG